MPPNWAGPVTVTVPRRPSASTRRLDGLRVDLARLDDDVTRLRGLPVTTLARTVADGIRLLGVADGVPLADAALARGLAPPELATACAAACRRPGARRLVAARPLIDGRRESWLESRSVVELVGLGVPLPRSQVQVFDGDDLLVARLDFDWEGGVVGEADGLVKYGTAGAGDDVERGRRALVAEKRREDALRRLGLTAVDLTPAGGERPLCSRMAGPVGNCAPARPLPPSATLS